jgi:hypothetical protein
LGFIKPWATAQAMALGDILAGLLRIFFTVFIVYFVLQNSTDPEETFQIGQYQFIASRSHPYQLGVPIPLHN